MTEKCPGFFRLAFESWEGTFFMEFPPVSTRLPIHTSRLELIPMTAETCRYELGKDHHSLSRCLAAIIPPSWPPELMDHDALEQFMAMLSVPGSPGFHTAYWIKKPDTASAERFLIGSGGFFIADNGIPELGYSVLEPFQNQGYATEAVREMITWVFSHTSAGKIQATTFPDLIPSIRVLTRTGFIRTGSGSEDRSIRYEQTRKSHESRA